MQAAAGDEAALRALAARRQPDVWIVADTLIGEGAPEAATALAAAAEGPALARLGAYVAAQRDRPDDADQRRLLATVVEAAKVRRVDDALAAAEQRNARLETVCDIRLCAANGLLLAAKGKLQPAGALVLEAAAAAHRIGWYTRANELHKQAGGMFGGRSDEALAAWRGWLASAEALGNAAGVAAATTNIGSAYFQRGEFEPGATWLEKGVALARAAGAREHLARGLSMVGQLRLQQRKPMEARAALEESLALAEQTNDALSRAASSVLLGRTFIATGEYGKAVAHLEVGLDVSTRIRNGQMQWQALEHLAWAYWNLKDYERALPLYEQVLRVRLQRKDPEGIRAAFANMGQIYVRQLRFDDALRNATAYLGWAEEQGDALARADALLLRAESETARGQLREGMRTFQKALAANEKLGRKHALSEIYRHMAHALRRTGRLSKARRYVEQAVKMAAASGDSKLLALAWLEAVAIHEHLGSYDVALDAADRALVLVREQGDRVNEAAALGSKARLRKQLGDPGRAIPLQQEAIRILEQIGDERRLVAAWGNLAAMLSDLGRQEPVFVAMEKAIAIAERDGNDAAVAHYLGNIAAAHANRGQLDEALTTARRALALAEKANAQGTALQVRMHLATVLDRKGQTAEASEQFEALEREAHRRRDAVLSVQVLDRLGGLRLAGGDTRGALDAARRGIRELEEMLGGLAETEGSTARQRFGRLYELGAVAAAREDDADEVVAFLEAGRAGMLMEALRGRDVLKWSDVPEELREAEARAHAAVGAARRELDRLAASANRKQRKALAAKLDAALEEMRNVATRMQREAKRQAGLLYPRPETLDHMQGMLAEGEVLILYGLCLKQALAVVATQDEARVVDLGPRAAVEAAYASLTLSDADEPVGKGAERLRALLVDPLELPEDATQVVISPDGPLCQLPFGMLFDPLPVGLTPSGTTYAFLREENFETGDGVFAVGDPVYEGTASGRAAKIYTRAGAEARVTRSGALQPLPATRPEVKAIGDVILLGKDATERGVREALPQKDRWRAVHFACHGLVNPGRADLSSLALTQEGKDDGFLTSLEVLRLDMPADLAVLSACDTGTGRVVKGEGLLGLTRSFLYAGASRVLCSLWKVDDDATRALMVEFYRLWNPRAEPAGPEPVEGLGAAEALRRAQQHVRAQPKWSHPYFWSGWVLWGLAD